MPEIAFISLLHEFAGAFLERGRCAGIVDVDQADPGVADQPLHRDRIDHRGLTRKGARLPKPMLRERKKTRWSNVYEKLAP